jgi:hypothetical protein
VRPCKCFEDSVKIKMDLFTSDKALEKHRRQVRKHPARSKPQTHLPPPPKQKTQAPSPSAEALTAKGRAGQESSANRSIEDILCEECGKGDDEKSILLCDACSAGYHMRCLTPPLSKRPAGLWLCGECQEEADEEARAEADKEARNRKCCACGSRGEEAAVQHLLASAWAGAAVELGAAPAGRFSLCRKCAGKQEQSWRLGPAEAVMGAPKLCCICLGDGTKGAAAGNPRTLACSGCPRVHCYTCVSRNVAKTRQPPSPAKSAGGGGKGAGAGVAVTVPGWLCPVCDPKSMASPEELAVAAKRRAAWTKAAEAGVCVRERRGGGRADYALAFCCLRCK